MSDTTATAPAAGNDLDLEAGSILLAELTEAVRQADAATARAVAAAGRLAGSGVTERLEGLPLDLLLATACRSTGSDRGALLTAAEVLGSLPEVAALFTDGALSWGQVRRIVTAARKLDSARRAVLDARIAATCAQHGGLDAFSPDDLCDQVDAAADALRDPRSRERAEQRKARGEFLSLQSDLDGGIAGYFNLGPVSAAILLNALTAQITALDHATTDGQPNGDTPDAGEADGDVAAATGWTGRDRSRRQAQALIALATASLAGMFASGKPRPAKPLFTCIIDLRTANRTAAGTIDLDVPGPLPTITARLVEALARDADLQAVLFHGHRPLAVSAKLTAEHLPADVRTAVRVRDRGSRFPGSRQPTGRCHIHHLTHREHGGTNDVDNLACVSAYEHHHPIHRHGWHGRYDPHTGIITWTRRGRTLRTLPRGTPLNPPPHTDHPPDPQPPPDREHPPTRDPNHDRDDHPDDGLPF